MKVLFVGNSHTYVNDMPQIFKLNANIDVDVFMLARGGITFATHLQDPSLQFCMKQDYDVVIYQQAAHVPCPSKEETLRDGAKLIELARSFNKEVYVLKPWPVENDREGYKAICDIYETLHTQENVEIIDVGTLINQINPKYTCYLSDHEHLNPLGSYIEACAILHQLFNQTSFKGLTLDMKQVGHFKPIEIDSEQKLYVEKIIGGTL